MYEPTNEGYIHGHPPERLEEFLSMFLQDEAVKIEIIKTPAFGLCHGWHNNKHNYLLEEGSFKCIVCNITYCCYCVTGDHNKKICFICYAAASNDCDMTSNVLYPSKAVMREEIWKRSIDIPATASLPEIMSFYEDSNYIVFDSVDKVMYPLLPSSELEMKNGGKIQKETLFSMIDFPEFL